MYTARTRKEVNPYIRFARYTTDTGWTLTAAAKAGIKKNYKNFDEAIPDSIQNEIIENASNQVTGIKNNVNYLAVDYQERQNSLQLHQIEWHRKFTLSAACLVLFLIGAPLGSIIRKGGLGTPLVFAIIFFVIFHLFNTFGEKFVKSAQLSPLMGMWLSTFILLPISIFLVVKAMADAQLFNQEYYYRLFTKIRAYTRKF
jgi:lipopolysaccharide export system permease protein